MSAKNTVFGLKGNIVYSKTPMQLEICENGYLVCEEGKVKGVYPALPDTYAGIPVKDYGDRLLIRACPICMSMHRSMHSAVSEWIWNCWNG